LWGLGQCYAAQHRYQEALDAYLTVRQAFVSLEAPAEIPDALNGSLSSLYVLLGEYDAASKTIRVAMEDTSGEDSNGRRARHLMGLATVLSQKGNKQDAKDLFEQAILEAGPFDDAELRREPGTTWARTAHAAPAAPGGRGVTEAYRIRS